MRQKKKPVRGATAGFPARAAEVFREHAAAMRKLGADHVSVKWGRFEMTAGWATPPEKSGVAGFGFTMPESS